VTWCGFLAALYLLSSGFFLEQSAQYTGKQSLIDFTDAVGISESFLGRVTTPANNVHFVNIDDLGFVPRRMTISPEPEYAGVVLRFKSS
jgi:archaellin